MDDKSKLELYDKLKDERNYSNQLYAPMIVKVIVFGMVGIILTTALVALLAKIITK
jgi:hypothetical protein